MSENVQRLRANRDVCIGAGMCVMTADDVFDQDDDGIVMLLTTNPARDVTDAVRNCPSGALSLDE